jgi:hypothetical protein
MRFSAQNLRLRDMPIWLRVIWFGALANFAVFWIVAVLNGGDAVSGREEGGRYFVSSHGHYTEISKAFFEYSLIHTRSVWFTHPLALGSLFWFLGRRKDPIP